MRAYFLSDLHLIDGQEINSLALLHFLRSERARTATHLFLLGDVFDLWISSHQFFHDRFKAIIEELKELKGLGVRLYIFEGNHDLYLKDFFVREIGAEVVEEPVAVTLGNLTLRLEHGDLMNPDDRGYRFLKWLLHTPLMRVLARHLPQSIVSAIGTKMSETSRRYTSTVKKLDGSRLEKMTENYVSELKKIDFNVHIAGHVHHRFIKPFNVNNSAVTLINLGWWKFERTILEINYSSSSLENASSTAIKFLKLDENGSLRELEAIS